MGAGQSANLRRGGVLGRAFLVVSALFLALLAFAFYQDLSRPWVSIQDKYAKQYGADFPIGVQQLFPRVQVNNQFVVERCITCHVPDIQKIGPQEAAKRLGPNHPAVINDAVFAKYGQDTLICRPVTAAASPSASAAAASPKPSASAAPSAAPSASPAAAAAASCLDPRATPFYLLDANGHQVTDPSTKKPVVADLTGFIPSQYKGLGIDESGCIICHNGNRQATTEAGAHQDLVPNPFGVWVRGARARHSTTRTGWGSSVTTTTIAASTLATPVKSTSTRSCRPGAYPRAAVPQS